MNQFNTLQARFAFLLIVLMTGIVSSNAQTTTITTTGSGYTGSTSSGTNSFVTFVIYNGSGSDVLLTTVGRHMTTSHNSTTAKLYYSSSSLSGSPGSLTSPTWTLISSGTVTGITSSGIDTALSGMSFLIPNGVQYRFALHTTGTNYYSGSSATPNTFTASGITLKVNNAQINSMNIGYGGANSPRAFTGFVVLEPAGAPCPAPGTISVTNVSSISANISWTTVPGSQGYEYALTTSATPPTSGFTTTTGNSYAPTGLTPATAYHFHVRNKCAPPYQTRSGWKSYPFNTNPPCSDRRIKVKNITVNSADIEWDTASHASAYEYAISTSKTIPPAKSISSSSSVFNAKGLNEGTTYYVFVKMKCPVTESSNWVVDSFRTLFVCRPPVLNVDNISADKAIVHWNAMPTAIKYEYELSQSPTPLGKGTSILKNSFYAFPLKDGETYYYHVKSVCHDQGVDSESDWTSTSFLTYPTSVSNKTIKTRIMIFPNPAKDVINIDLEKVTENSHAVITDLSGKEVIHIPVTQKLTSININALAAGTYILKYSDQSISRTFKFTKL